MNKTAVLASVLVLAVCAVMAPPAGAQVLYGSLVVEARDQSGGALPFRPRWRTRGLKRSASAATSSPTVRPASRRFSTST